MGWLRWVGVGRQELVDWRLNPGLGQLERLQGGLQSHHQDTTSQPFNDNHHWCEHDKLWPCWPSSSSWYADIRAAQCSHCGSWNGLTHYYRNIEWSCKTMVRTYLEPILFHQCQSDFFGFQWILWKFNGFHGFYWIPLNPIGFFLLHSTRFQSLVSLLCSTRLYWVLLLNWHWSYWIILN